ncbi:hypothetical protein EV586_101263 [Tumebacillus sp. BK434]|uniref:hypothetical protein n=1 Tax=Tumebacillus sp. BK434 TaxID=2512169 RepID=UPI0010D55B81|nr:hypothetical protein [Tumebacillus sp. BK434]TCP59064.1 hypothetical protein EV586_101263 [Tumebacillus sp. BK434]
MKPKAKPHVHYAATEDGVYFRTWTNEFVIKGPTIYQWVEQVLPYLTGEKTLDELVVPLPEAQANFVRTLVGELVRRGVVVDVSADSEVPVSELEQKLYRQTILYLEDQAVNGRELFRKFRSGRVLLSGAGLSFRALVRSLIKMGLHAPVIVESGDAELDRLAEQWNSRDQALQVTWLPAGRECEWLRAQGERPDLVVHVSDWYDDAFVGQLTAVCAERNVPALVGTQLFGIGVVGPLLDASAAAGWDCLLDRFVPPGETLEAAESPVFRVMIGNVAALESFKAVTGLANLNVRDEAALIDPRLLEAKHHKLWPSPLRNKGQAAAERFWQVEEAAPLREFLGQLEGIKDERLGVLNLLHPGDLWQIPFAHAQAIVRLPGLAEGRPLAVIAGGEQIDEAMEMAVREALTAYARLVQEQLDETLRGADAAGSSAHEDRDKQSGGALPGGLDVAWSHGRDVHEWQGRGILQALARRADRAGEVLQEFTAADFGATLEQTYWKMLTLRYGLQVRLFAVDLGLESAHLVRIWQEGQWIGLGSGRTRREALKTALLQALSNCQLQENHPEQLTAATVEAAPCPVAATKLTAVPVEQIPAWKEWNGLVQEQLRQQGVRITATPWLNDAAPLEMGVLVGQIGLEEESG